MAIEMQKGSGIKQQLALLMLLISLSLFAAQEVASDDVILLSGTASGELFLNFTINSIAPVFSGSYSYDLVGIHIPPISSSFSISFPKGVIQNIEGKKISGYAYEAEGIYMPASPNNFTVSASKVRNLNIGLKKLQGSYENSSRVWMGKSTRLWITSQIQADKNGTATTSSDLLSPGSYDAKIFGNAAENVSQVNLTMTLIKKIIVNGRFNLCINTTGFPSGTYSITAKALNGSFHLDELKLDGLSTFG